MTQSYSPPRQSAGHPYGMRGNDRPSQHDQSRIDAELLKQIVFEELKSGIFSDIAEKAAGKVNDPSGKRNKRAQLRRFYDELVMWNDSVQQAEKRDEKYNELVPFIKMLKAKVVYAKGREHVDETFKMFFSHCIDQITSAKTLKHCKLFMEAFMGYYKALDK
jgi:CRISPR-associated protein Csm2